MLIKRSCERKNAHARQGRTTRLGEACRAAGGHTWRLQFQELTGPVLSYSPPSHYSLGIGMNKGGDGEIGKWIRRGGGFIFKNSLCL
jgi:hypothetical protein